MEFTRNQNGGQNMLYNYFTEKLLGLQGVLIENIEEIDDTIHIYCKLERKIHKCPVCGNHTKFTITENRLSRIFRLLESLFSFTSKSVDIVAHAESGFMKRILFFPVFTE